MTTEAEAGFEVSTYSQGLIEDNVRESFGVSYGDPQDRADALAAGFIDNATEITIAGWQQLRRDIDRLERNAMKWLNKTFIHARDDGHSSEDSLVGIVWFDPTDPNQAELIELASSSPGRSERIDMQDTSYGNLAHTVWDGVSGFGARVLGGQINFYDIDAEVWDTIEKTLSQTSKGTKPGAVKFDLDGVPPQRRLPRWVRR